MKNVALFFGIALSVFLPTSSFALSSKTDSPLREEQAVSVDAPTFPDVSACADAGDLLRWEQCACTEALDQAILICKIASFEACRAAAERASGLCWLLFPDKFTDTSSN